MRASSGSLAQLVEQRTLNPFVAGSIPARPTSIYKASSDGSLFIFCVISLPWLPYGSLIASRWLCYGLLDGSFMAPLCFFHGVFSPLANGFIVR